MVVGEVRLGARSSIWFNAVLRADVASITIGAESNVQDGSVVHEDAGCDVVVGTRVTIGHRAVIHGCVIEDECLIGMGAIVLTGARVGSGSPDRGRALIKEGHAIPPGSLVVGMPARVIGPVSDLHRAAIARGWSNYVDMSRGYMARGFAYPHPSTSSPTGRSVRDRPPMSFAEWERLLSTLAGGPAWAAERLDRGDEARWRRPEAEGRWSALEVLCHLRDADRDVYLPRLERMLTAIGIDEPDVDLIALGRMRGHAGESPAGALAAWAAERRKLVARLAGSVRPSGAALGRALVRGPFPLGDMVRSWVEHDLSHRRQIARALGETA